MKKLIALLLSLMMLVSAFAMAESFDESVLLNYAVTMDAVPTGYEIETYETESGIFLLVSTASDEDCMYFISVAPSEEFSDYTLTAEDLDNDENIADMLDVLAEEYFDPSMEIRETAYGTPVIVLNENNAESDYAELLTVWHGYIVSVDLLKDGDITEADLSIAMDLMSNLWVVDKAEEAPAQLAGGWTVTTEDLDNDKLDIFYKAAGDNTELQPMALLGTQVVAGTNYAVLCADAEGWKIAYIYAALDGTATLERVQLLVPMAEVPGGYQIMTPEADDYDTAQAKVAEALSSIVGASYTHATILASQVVSGTNYIVIAQKTPVIPNPTTSWALVTVYVDLDGTPSITNIEDITLSLAE